MGPHMAYYITDTLTEIRWNPASPHGRFIYSTVNDTPCMGLATPDWVVHYSLNDVSGPVPYDPTYLTGALTVSRRFGWVWPFVRITGRLFNGEGEYCDSGYCGYYEYRNSLALSVAPGVGFQREGWLCSAWAGWGFLRDTYQLSSDSIRLDGSGVAFGSENRFLLGNKRDWSLVFGFHHHYYSEEGRGSTAWIRGQILTQATLGTMREITLGPDAVCWIGFVSYLQKEEKNGRWTLDESEIMLAVPGAAEIGFGKEKRFIFRIGGSAFDVFRLEGWVPAFDYPHISLDAWGLGFCLYDRLRVDMLNRGGDALDPRSYSFEATYRF